MPAPTIKEVLQNLINGVQAAEVKWQIAVENKDRKVQSTSIFDKARGAIGLGGFGFEERVKKTRESNSVTKLKGELNTLKDNLPDDPATAMSEIRRVMIIAYIDEYAHGRENKKDSKLLTAMEDIILKAAEPDYNFLMKNEHLAIKQGMGHDHFDSRFLAMSYAPYDPELIPVVEHIFKASIGSTMVDNETNRNLYTNYMKAFVRVGLEVAPSVWNDLVVKHIGSVENNAVAMPLERVKDSNNWTEAGIQKYFSVVASKSNRLGAAIQAYLDPSRGAQQDAYHGGMTSSDDLLGTPKAVTPPPVTRPTITVPPPYLSQTETSPKWTAADEAKVKAEADTQKPMVDAVVPKVNKVSSESLLAGIAQEMGGSNNSKEEKSVTAVPDQPPEFLSSHNNPKP